MWDICGMQSESQSRCGVLVSCDCGIHILYLFSCFDSLPSDSRYNELATTRDVQHKMMFQCHLAIVFPHVATPQRSVLELWAYSIQTTSNALALWLFESKAILADAQLTSSSLCLIFQEQKCDVRQDKQEGHHWSITYARLPPSLPMEMISYHTATSMSSCQILSCFSSWYACFDDTWFPNHAMPDRRSPYHKLYQE